MNIYENFLFLLAVESSASRGSDGAIKNQLRHSVAGACDHTATNTPTWIARSSRLRFLVMII
jgi:hypothetical protein